MWNFSVALWIVRLLILQVEAHVDSIGKQLMPEALEWPRMMSMNKKEGLSEGNNDEEEGYSTSVDGQRSLYGSTRRYYISYGAVFANRVPCPPRSGRSYYTKNCFKARGPFHPCTRGCSAITNCRR